MKIVKNGTIENVNRGDKMIKALRFERLKRCERKDAECGRGDTPSCGRLIEGENKSLGRKGGGVRGRRGLGVQE